MLDAIKKRRSIRFYKSDLVSDEQIEEVIKAGFCAPTAHNERKWHVVVVKNQEIKDKISTIHKWARFISSVPVAIIVCVDKTALEHYWIEDASAFMQNMLIQATEIGLASCWIGIRGASVDGVDAEKIVREACNISDKYGVLAITPLGYSARYPGENDQTIPEGRVHYDKMD